MYVRRVQHKIEGQVTIKYTYIYICIYYDRRDELSHVPAGPFQPLVTIVVTFVSTCPHQAPRTRRKRCQRRSHPTMASEKGFCSEAVAEKIEEMSHKTMMIQSCITKTQETKYTIELPKKGKEHLLYPEIVVKYFSIFFRVTIDVCLMIESLLRHAPGVPACKLAV